jgi:hypothetical protein
MDSTSLESLKHSVTEQIRRDRDLLDQLRGDIRKELGQVHPIRPRATTAVSLVAADGGNNQIQFDPFLVQLVRVVDSSHNEYCLEAITPTTDTAQLARDQFARDGTPRTALGEMMASLSCTRLSELSPMIRETRGDPPSSSWVQVYRDLVEWAILYKVIRKDFGSDTLIVFDGLLRSKVFRGDLFVRLMDRFKEAIDAQLYHSRRRIYLVGLAKHSKVLARYRLALALEGILRTNYPAYVEVPREIEMKAYAWSEYARGSDFETTGEANKFVGGNMLFVKFGASANDPIWPVDIFSHQKHEAPTILGYLLADAVNGFPIPFYPRCLQKAHEFAAMVNFDFAVLQDFIIDGIRQTLGAEADRLDALRLQDADPAAGRYAMDG